MMGSETFIIVAFRWSEKRTSLPSRFGDLLFEKGDEGLLVHDRGVKDFSGLERESFL